MSDPQLGGQPAGGSRSQVFQAAGLVAVLVLLSRIVGLVREIVIRSLLGITTLEATAYDIASRFPEAIFLIVAGGAIGSAFIPTFAAYFVRDDEKGGWRLFSAVVNLVFLFVTVVSALTMLFAGPLAVFFFGDNMAAVPALLPLTVRLMRIMLISPVIFGVSGVIMGALNARQHFLLPALAPTMYNLGIIAGAITARLTGLLTVEEGLALGTVVGALGHLMIQLPGLWRKGAHYRAVFTVRDPGVRTVLRLMAPRVLGLSFSEVNKFIILFLTGSMSLGSLPALNAAFRLIIMPQGILGQAMGIAAFPTLSRMAARSEFDDMRQILADSLRLLLFFGLPAMLLLLMLRQPVVVILFRRGAFGEADTRLVTWALLFLAPGLIALMALEVIARAFYALSDTLTPVLAGAVQIGIMALLSLWLSRRFEAAGLLPLGGLALGFSLSNFVEAGLLLWLFRRKIGGIRGRHLLDGTWRMLVAGLGMAGTIATVLRVWPDASIWWHAFAGSVAGLSLYVLICQGLKVSEWQLLQAYARRCLPR